MILLVVVIVSGKNWILQFTQNDALIISLNITIKIENMGRGKLILTNTLCLYWEKMGCLEFYLGNKFVGFF